MAKKKIVAYKNAIGNRLGKKKRHRGVRKFGTLSGLKGNRKRR